MFSSALSSCHVAPMVRTNADTAEEEPSCIVNCTARDGTLNPRPPLGPPSSNLTTSMVSKYHRGQVRAARERFTDVT